MTPDDENPLTVEPADASRALRLTGSHETPTSAWPCVRLACVRGAIAGAVVSVLSLVLTGQGDGGGYLVVLLGPGVAIGSATFACSLLEQLPALRGARRRLPVLLPATALLALATLLVVGAQCFYLGASWERRSLVIGWRSACALIVEVASDSRARSGLVSWQHLMVFTALSFVPTTVGRVRGQSVVAQILLALVAAPASFALFLGILWLAGLLPNDFQAMNGVGAAILPLLWAIALPVLSHAADLADPWRRDPAARGRPDPCS